MGAKVSLGAIVRAKGGELVQRVPLNAAQRKVMRAMADCRSAALGGHRDSCDSCGYEHIFWNSCRDRHCPGCGGQARERWLDARRDEVLDVPYFHVVFTIPDIFNVLALHAPNVIYAILLRSAGQALLDLGASRLHARMGVLAVLHTWAQTLVHHPPSIVSFPAAGSPSMAAAGRACPGSTSSSPSNRFPDTSDRSFALPFARPTPTAR